MGEELLGAVIEVRGSRCQCGLQVKLQLVIFVIVDFVQVNIIQYTYSYMCVRIPARICFRDTCKITKLPGRSLQVERYPIALRVVVNLPDS